MITAMTIVCAYTISPLRLTLAMLLLLSLGGSLRQAAAVTAQATTNLPSSSNASYTVQVVTDEVYQQVLVLPCDILVENFKLSGTCCALTDLELEGCEIVVSNGWCDILEKDAEIPGEARRHLLFHSTNPQECPVGGYNFTLGGEEDSGGHHTLTPTTGPTAAQSPILSNGSGRQQQIQTISVLGVVVTIIIIIAMLM